MRVFTVVEAISGGDVYLLLCSRVYTSMETYVCLYLAECAEDLANCHAARGTCTNHIGSYECTCLPQFQGDGFLCTDRLPSTPPLPPFAPPAPPPPGAPPPPPSPPGMWTSVQFDRWPGAENWTIYAPEATSLISACGDAQMLGGYRQFGRHAWVEKTFRNLPPHTDLRVQLTFWKSDASGIRT